MSSNKIDRREFLKSIGYSSLALTLPLTSGCRTQTRPNSKTAVSLVKDPDESYCIKQALEMIDGLDFVAAGDSVLLKLALNSPSPFPASTSPSMISVLIKLLKEQGAGDIFVGDKTPVWHDEIGGTLGCMEQTGIYQAAVDAGAEAVVFEEDDMVPVNPAGALYWPEGFSMPAIFSRVDHIIALPTLRTHQLADFTMSMKIFVGAIPQDQRFYMHSSNNFFEAIAEIALCTDKIRLCVLDARQGFNTKGPDSGNLITPGIIIASKSLVAADAVGVALLQAIGTTEKLMSMSVWDHPTIVRGIEVYSPALSFETMDLRSEGIDSIDDIKEKLS